MKFLRLIGVTRKTARDTVWLDVFTDKVKNVIINQKDGRRIYGWPEYYSNTPENGMIYLANPAWVDNGEYIDLDIDGIFLIAKDNIESIEFMNKDINTEE